MLSVILYGRNDSHGYNYTKRLAVSLNCMAEMLSDPDDEIVFVDYHSQEDEPTALEAAQDTLTEKTQALVKIIRVRPSLKCFKKGAILPAEPLSRNLAIRQTNPANPWILSTNIDMIFTTSNPQESLSTIVSDLPQGLYQLPRFELPENLWESEFDRLKPKENLEFLRKHALALHLQTKIRRPGFLCYDNPGDFQLMPRQAIFEIGGFNEQMLDGWHVDSNLCKRMFLYYNQKVETLEGRVAAYHCNHTRQHSSLHHQLHGENDWNRFVRDVDSPEIPQQMESWGLQGATLEVMKLKQQTGGIKALGLTLELEGAVDRDIEVGRETFNCLSYASKRIFPYLADHFYHLPPGCTIVYIGYNQTLQNLIQYYLKERDFDGEVIVKDPDCEIETLYAKDPFIMIFDFGFERKTRDITPSSPDYLDKKRQLKAVQKAFLRAVALEKMHRTKVKFIGVNALYTDFRALLHHHLTIRKNTVLTGICFGYLKEKKKYRPRVSLKKKIKFLLMYFFVRYFYRYTDKLRKTSYESTFLQKVLQIK